MKLTSYNFLGGNSICQYSCTSTGGCNVRYTGPSRYGSALGSCWPASASGRCGGTPPECRDCKLEINCDQVRDTSKRNPCDYKCTGNGQCTVQYIGPPRSGSGLGACFSKRFGGQCTNTPPECQDCNKIVNCEESTNPISTTPIPTTTKRCK